MHNFECEVLEFNEIMFEDAFENDSVIYTGYPGCLKRQYLPHEILTTRFTFGANITTVEYDQLSIRISPEKYKYYSPMHSDLKDLGGMSGTPIFKYFDYLSKRYEYPPKLVGFITQANVFWRDFLGRITVNNQKHYGVHASALLEMLQEI